MNTLKPCFEADEKAIGSETLILDLNEISEVIIRVRT